MERHKHPGIVEVTFELPDEQNTIGWVIEITFQTCSNQEPVIRLQKILRSLSKGLDYSKNLDRWWNNTGDGEAKSQ